MGKKQKRQWYITLTRGYRARVDYIDWRWARKLNWYTHSDGYACRTAHSSPEIRRAQYLHRVIAGRARGRAVPPHLRVDHRDRDRLNCCRSNLRVCTVRTNNLNRSQCWAYWYGERWAITPTAVIAAPVRPQVARKQRGGRKVAPARRKAA